MKIRECMYGQQGDGKGYGFIFCDPEVDPVRYGKYLDKVLNTDQRETSIRGMPAEEGEYLLSFVTFLPEGSKREERGQSFVHAYILDDEAADKLMREPGKIPRLRHCVTPDDMGTEVRCPLRLETAGKDTHAVEKKLPEEVQKQYFEAVFDNARGGWRCQILHVVPGGREEMEGTVMAALKLFPPKMRKYISWNTNAKTMRECNSYELNAMDRETYARLEQSGYAGGKAVRRIVLEGDKVVRGTEDKDLDALWERYRSAETRKQAWRRCDRSGGDRRTVLDCLSGCAVTKGEMKSRNASVPSGSRETSVSTKKRREKRGNILLAGKVAGLIVSLLWLVFMIQIQEVGAREYTVHVSGDFLCFLLQFAVCFLLTEILEDVRRARRERREKG